MAKMQYAANYDPSITLDLPALPPLDEEVQDSWGGFLFINKLESTSFRLATTEKDVLPALQSGVFKLPEDDLTLELLDASSSSAYDTAEDDRVAASNANQSDTEDEDHPWLLTDVKDASRAHKLNSWDHFLSDTHREPSTAYLAEAGAKSFDAILALQDNRDPPKIGPDGPFIDALFELAMGRSSQYMRWDMQHQEFEPTATRLTMSGYSSETVDELRDSLAAMGRILRRIRGSNSGISAATPSQLAFSGSLNTISTALERFLQDRRPQIASLIQLQHLMEGPRLFLASIEGLAALVMSPMDDVATLDQVLRSVQHVTTTLPRCRPLFDALLSAVSGPVLARMKTDLHAKSQGNKFSNSMQAWSSLLPDDLAQLVLEVQTSIQLLLVVESTSIEEDVTTLLDRVELGLKFSWEELAILQEQVNQVELQTRSRTTTLECDAVVPSLDVQKATMEFEHLCLDDLTPSLCHREYANLDALVLTCFAEEVETTPAYPIPYDQVIQLSLGPVIVSQHRLASFSALRTLLIEENLHIHLRMVKEFLLLGNGSFATRVSTALFDSELSSGEGSRRDGNTTGLRLQNRDAWPPASSELRLVLTGILTEHLPLSVRSQFEEAISFSLRDLSDEDLERCRNVDSIYALDFLRLHYKAPSPLLEAVITTDILDKYDRVLQYLLRLLRVQSVAQTLLREVSCRAAARVHSLEHRFRIEIQHAVSALADYAHNTVLTHTWTAFYQTITEVLHSVESDEYDRTLQAGCSLGHLRDLHDEALNSILRALLLKEKQNKARRLIEELFGVVLRFAAILRKGTTSVSDSIGATTRRLYDEFKMCLSDLKEALQKEGGLTEHLLFRLGM